MRILITGGAGFIGSALIRYLITQTEHSVVNVDKLTYAANLSALNSVSQSSRYTFEHADICASGQMSAIFSRHQPDAIMHLAAESHVDRSINGAADFIQTNIVGTYTLLEISRQYWESLSKKRRQHFRFHHISTDEVYGDLEESEALFDENCAYMPSSPYSASKAASDHLVRAWGRTYGLPFLISHCSNNYGPFQHEEKLIPKMILNALAGKPLPIYGNGLQVRDWLFVDDHVKALYLVLSKGKIGETYNIGGNNQKTNLEVVQSICAILDKIAPIQPLVQQTYADLITYVEDRPGHDLRYAIDSSKITQELAWCAEESFESGLSKTVEWYLHYYAPTLSLTGVKEIPAYLC